MNKYNTHIVIEYLLISIIVLLTLYVRTYKLNSPLADWHSWRQADTSAVTRRFVREGIDLLHPKYDDLSNIPSGKDNPLGLRFVEFPFVNAITAVFSKLYPLISLEVWGRLTSILFSLGATLTLYFIMKIYATRIVAVATALIFALLPFNIYYHRTILPEVPMLFFSLVAFYYFLRWSETEKQGELIISAVAGAAALLLKPFVIFMVFPMLYQVWRKWDLGILRKKELYWYFAIVVIPFLLWRLWAAQYPQGIPANAWLLNGSGIRFRPAFFRWIFAERIGKLILGYWGLIPLAIGFIRKPLNKAGWLFHWWLFGMGAYLIIFATGNVTHDYYQIFIIPPIVIFTALGLDFLIITKTQLFQRTLAILLAVTAVIFWFGFSWFYIRDFFNINHPEIVEAGEMADAILPSDAKVVAPYLGDTAFLYQTKRQGWPIGGQIKDKIEKGATDYVTVNFDEETNFLLSRCKPAIKTDRYVIISLRNCSL